MVPSNVRRLEKHDEAEAIMASTDDARRVARTLEDAVLFRVAEFLDPGEAAAVCKTFFEAATKTSESFLNGIETNRAGAFDPEWRLRLAQHVLDSYKRFYFGDHDAAAANQHPTPRVKPTLHPRLLYQSAFRVPLMRRVGPHIGPSVVLPNGNIAMACSDNALRILDTRQMKWTDVAAGGSLDPQRVPFPPADSVAERLAVLLPDHPSAETLAAILRDVGGNALLGQLLQNWNGFSWITDRLFYSEGHLVLHQKPISSLFIKCSWLHVWKLEGQGENVSVRHLYTKDLKGNCLSAPPQVPGSAAASPPPDGNAVGDFPPEVKSVAVAPDGMFYFLRQAPETDHSGVSYLIQSFDVGTGNCLAGKTIRMPPSPPGANRPRYTADTLRISGDFLWLSRHVEEGGPFPGIGLGVYSFSRTNLLQTGFLPCFEEGEVWINEDSSGQNNWILSQRISEGFFRKILIDGAGVLAHEERRITFGDRDEVKLTRDNRVFVGRPDEGGDIRLDEFDVATGHKIRTISTGVPREGHMVASVLCNGVEIFCVFSARAGVPENVVQSFLL